MGGLTEFLLARIAEDESPGRVRKLIEGDARFAAPSLSTRRFDRETAAKRLIVARFVETAPPYSTADQQIEHEQMASYVIEPLAAIYADHPDYREEWQTPEAAPAQP